jgi:hypothetical protein
MSDATLRVVAWLGLAIHLAVGAVVLRHKAPVSLLAVLNLVTAGSVLIYWGVRWYGYLFRGITWYASDQLIPAYALLVSLLCVLALTGRYHGVAVHGVVFGVNTLVLLSAALFFTFFRMTRLF